MEPPRHPPRSCSTPLFERVSAVGTPDLGGGGHAAPGADCQRNPAEGRNPYARSVWRAQDEKKVTHSDRSARSGEQVKIECLNLRTELANRRKEVQQLQHRVQLLEGTLQVRTQQLESLVEEVRAIAGAVDADGGGGHAGAPCDRQLGETLDNIMKMHLDTYSRLEVREDDRQDVLKERLTESQAESQCSAMKSRNCDKTHLRQKLGHARRSARRQEELLAAYEHTHHDLYKRMQKMAQQLETERHARRDQEKTAQRLGEALNTSCAKQRLMKAISTANSCTEMIDAAMAPARPARPPGEPTGLLDALSSSEVCAMRQELEALRGEEREQRAAARRRRRHSPEPGAEGLARGGADDRDIAALRAALAGAEQRCAGLAEEHAAMEEALMGEAAQVESELLEEAQESEDRVWYMTEMVNEVALQSDMRELRALQAEVEMKRQLQNAEDRCSVLETVANSVAAGSAALSPGGGWGPCCPHCGRADG